MIRPYVLAHLIHVLIKRLLSEEVATRVNRCICQISPGDILPQIRETTKLYRRN